jgi:hypothetical protein
MAATCSYVRAALLAPLLFAQRGELLLAQGCTPAARRRRATDETLGVENSDSAAAAHTRNALPVDDESAPVSIMLTDYDHEPCRVVGAVAALARMTAFADQKGISSSI